MEKKKGGPAHHDPRPHHRVKEPSSPDPRAQLSALISGKVSPLRWTLTYMRHISVRCRHLQVDQLVPSEFTCRVQTVTHEFIPRVLQMRSKTSPLKRTSSVLTEAADRMTYRCFSADHRMNHSFFSLYVHFFL